VIVCTVSLHYGNGLAFSGRPAGRPVSAPRASSSRVIPARGLSLRTGAQRALSALTAPRPGPLGPGQVSSGRADVIGSRRTGPGLALRIGSRTVPVSARSATSQNHRAERAASLGRCAAAGAVTWLSPGPASGPGGPAGVTVTWRLYFLVCSMGRQWS
jgi:hypothetical protein